MATKMAPDLETPSLQTEPRRSGGWFTRLQQRVKLAMGGDRDALHLKNNTHVSWRVYHDYHMLGIIDPRETRTFHIQKRGNVSARPEQVGDEVEYLVLPLNLRIERVEIYCRQMNQAVTIYDMRAA